MTVKEIISSTRSYNLHSHTQFCDGRADMARFADAAVKAGYKHYGFTPHSPIPFHSPCNMEQSQVEEYISEFNRLKEEYRGRINLYLSMEIDYLGEAWGASHDYFSSLPLDYKLSSIHFIPVADGETMIDVDGRPENFLDKMSKYFDNDIRYVVDKFYERTLEMIEAGGFDIIGHFDKIGFNASHFKPGIELERWYQKHLDNVIDAIAAKGIIAEVNTKAWEAPVGAAPSQIATYAPRLFPSPDTIRKLVSARIPVAINSDAHYPERISAGREAAFQIIDS
ncbi:histidinol-phosphatase [Duncaniella muris]|jgi:histidinol-phosphatase (PHP family)|uniref:histidinol-phosphatase n=3 Tax=Duncaniella muris TaxID=2094150 RepID=UPI000F4A9592|nr:histidinol-phosphatase [Duncaniella muris]ROS88395.1 histidinol-phosphatase HisJ family protein [Muribaculaceae bacterium Isolate-039 (Harlan)]ROS97813.1 histidinol-phosphatase HisJ family protein [Muribaculaceae bacterium Isolate-077 (Janvier)]ROS99302.1 histidinol-phosphatase HisJ family protein [Muribaculaceae bacterium Isolate-083 (Janvier)]ROT02147.1 histidinol-phosphatase HisJ family protein [Muribaculaceae bacterium Isolate-084 (Janvier)]GFI53050.1 histidinol-phosphatase [Muribaculac